MAVKVLLKMYDSPEMKHTSQLIVFVQIALASIYFLPGSEDLASNRDQPLTNCKAGVYQIAIYKQMCSKLTVLTTPLAISLDFSAISTAQKGSPYSQQEYECLINLMDDWSCPFICLYNATPTAGTLAFI